MDTQLYELSEKAGHALKARGFMMATAESCTGGWIGQVMTMVPGSSRWFDRGFVTYTNDAKQEMLGVQSATLKEFGAVSEQTVKEMVEGALARSRAQVAVAVSGIAGPDGGTPTKPVGTVMLAWGSKPGDIVSRAMRFSGDRDSVRRQTVIAALEGVLGMLARKD
ncbi:MAG TPA: nicotinamide-nucleotide amidase [Burkholderiales bacterium]|nr:nicotinamide-nucleotide amidase [Burkholderiales bacterium]